MGCCLRCCQPKPEAAQEVNTPKKDASSYPISRDSIGQIREQPHEDLKNSRADLVESNSQYYNEIGNRHHKNKKYKEAIKAYQQAMATSNPEMKYFTNLALAYKADNQLDQAIRTIDSIEDSSQFASVRSSQQYQKGQLIKAKCLTLQVKNYCVGSQFTAGENRVHKDKICKAIAILEMVHWSRSNSSDKADAYATATKIRQFLEREIIPKAETQNLLTYMKGRLSQGQAQPKRDGMDRIFEYYSSRRQILQEIEGVVGQIKQDALKGEEDFMQDPITYDALLEPIIVPSGVTYNKETLLDHFRNNGTSDPITHQEYNVREEILFKNHNIKKYVAEKGKLVTQDDLFTLKY